MYPRRFTFDVDEDTVLALRRLADADSRSMAAQVRWMIRDSAMRRGIWQPNLKLAATSVKK